MKRLNILCEDSKVADSREFSKRELGQDVLKTPVSANGKEPATHWFCFLTVNEAGYEKIMSLQKNSEIEEGNPKEFLRARGLKVIR
jgi:hypothetical protein